LNGTLFCWNRRYRPAFSTEIQFPQHGPSGPRSICQNDVSQLTGQHCDRRHEKSSPEKTTRRIFLFSRELPAANRQINTIKSAKNPRGRNLQKKERRSIL
jgi:hypothetical protein